MRFDTLTRAAGLAILLGGLACAGNKANDDMGAARDSTAVRADSAQDQTQSGVTDSSGQSTLGKDVEKTRPDQGQPVTSKGDTINAGVDSAAAGQGADTSSTRETTTDTSSMQPSSDTSSLRSSNDTSNVGQPADTSGMSGMSGMDSTNTRQGADSSSTQR